MERFLSYAVPAVMHFPGWATGKNAARCLNR